MWAIAINPASGHGKGIAFGEKVVQYFSEHELEYQVFSANSASELKVALDTFLSSNQCQGVISVGGDGLAHLILQLTVPRHIPFAN